MFEILLLCALSDLPDLKTLPGVESAEAVVKCDNPELTIVHVRDWHYIDYAAFKADVEGDIDGALIPDQYVGFAREVQEIQDQQELFLRACVKAGCNDVWIEGLTPDIAPAFRLICRAAAANGLYDSPNPLSVGVAGRLFVERIIRVHALDTDVGLKLTFPLDASGNLRKVPDSDVEKRENLMIRQLTGVRGVAIVVLGGAHDLSDNVPARVKLVVVTVKGYRKVSGE
ncbi:MAG: hypothetical protein O3B13_03905 [Planctomycetota bacterium]|nr:hypothetical protein [Planctomycetota bacterium]MDA1162226.1 hypothetical protein [Planctomycetota bacterium]